MKTLTVVLMGLLTLGLSTGALAGYEWDTSELSWSPGAQTPGWHGWWFRHATQWFEFTFSDIDTDLIDNFVTVEFHLYVTNHMNGESGLDGLIDVVINHGLIPTTTYTDVLLDNVDPNNHVYYMGHGGSYRTFGSIEVPKSYIIDGQLIVRVVRHTDAPDFLPHAPVCTEQPIDMSTTPPTVPPGVYEDDDAHTVHIYVWCLDGSGGHIITCEGGHACVSVLSDRGALDIKPGSCPNPLNRTSHGVLPVALGGTENFDVTQIDLSSVQLWRADGVGGAVAPNEGPPGPHSVFEDVATQFEGELCDCHDLMGDGILDLMMHFKTDDVVAALELDDLDAGDEVELIVTGQFLDESEFTSAGDCILIVPPQSGDLTVMSNVPGIWVDVDPQDTTLDGGGFTDFERGFPLTTVVTLTAEEWAQGRPLRGWQIGGLLHHMGETTVELTIDQDMTASAVYGPTPSGSPKPPGEMAPDEMAPEPFIEGESLESGTIDRR